MNHKKLLLIYPEDETTIFLRILISYFENIHENLIVERITASSKSHEKAINLILNEDFDVLLFLGHGSSNGVQGSSNDIYKHDFLLTKEHLPLLKNKDLIFLSCNSNEFLSKGTNFSFIGFGYMPTDYNDVSSAREMDSSVYKNITTEILENYKNCLIEILKAPILGLLNNEYSLKSCFNEIQLKINKFITLAYKNKQVELGYLLLDLRNDMKVFIH